MNAPYAPREQRPDDLFFEPIKELRGSFFVEYRPPAAGNPFATLSVVFLHPIDAHQIVSVVEDELRLWLSRYPLPILAHAFDVTGSLIRPSPAGDKSSACGWLIPSTGETRLSWRVEDLSAFLRADRPAVNLPEVYRGLPHRNRAQVEVAAAVSLNKRRLQASTIRLVIVAWVLIPGLWALSAYFGPNWLELTALLMSVAMALWAALRIAGHLKPSKRALENAEEERRRRHYFYHCERNPEGFARLKAENFERDAQRETLEEAARLSAR